MKLSFVTLAAYDYRYLMTSIGTYYPMADEILIGLDKDRISYSHKPFAFDDAEFFRMIKAVDRDDKIRVVEDNFHVCDTPMRNETYERNALSGLCRDGNWIVQIDADEYMVNGDEFYLYMQEHDAEDVLVQANWVTVFKSFPERCLVIDTFQAFDGVIPFATKRKRAYWEARNILDQPLSRSPLVLVHYAWGRTRDELHQKLTHWSHSQDFDTDRYLALWDSVTLENYGQFKDFHPIYGPYWRALKEFEIIA